MIERVVAAEVARRKHFNFVDEGPIMQLAYASRWAAAFTVIPAGVLMVNDVPKEDETYALGEIGQRIVEYVERAADRGFSGAVLAAKDGRVVAAVAAGHADPEGKVPNTPNTLFEIASATKPFTATAVMRLAQDGKLKLDDSIGKYLPGVPRESLPITVEHLLRHTSGIPGTNTRGEGDDINVVVPMFLRGGPQHEPGTRHEYWNQGYALLSEIIHQASGMSYVDYCREAIFIPAEMNTTRFTGDPAPAETTVAVGHCSFGPPRSALDHPYGNNYGFQYRGMGGIVTNVWDLWLFDRALKNDRLLSAEMKTLMFDPGPGSYAMGWTVAPAAGRAARTHNGSVRGFRADIRRYPNDDAFIAVLMNTDDISLHLMSRNIEMLLFEAGEPTLPTVRLLDQKIATDIVGHYQDEAGNVLEIQQRRRVVTGALRWTGANGNFPNTYLQIGRTADGQLAMTDRHAVMPFTIDRDDGGRTVRLNVKGHGPFKRMPDPVDPKEKLQRSAPLDPEAAAALVGRYRDQNGNELHVEIRGDQVLSRLKWAGGFPDTRAQIRQDIDGSIISYDGHSVLRVVVELESGQPVRTMSILSMNFERIE